VGPWNPNVKIIICYIFDRYEMLIGIPPFYDKDPNKMFMNIEKAPIRWPSLEGQGIRVSAEA